MTPEMYTNKGKVKVEVLEEDTMTDIERAGHLVAVIQKFIKEKKLDVVRVVLRHNFPEKTADAFTSAIIEKREGSINFKVLDDDNFQINQVSFPPNNIGEKK